MPSCSAATSDFGKSPPPTHTKVFEDHKMFGHFEKRAGGTQKVNPLPASDMWQLMFLRPPVYGRMQTKPGGP